MLVAGADVVDEATMRNMLPIRCGVVDPQQTRSGAAEFGKIKNVVTLDQCKKLLSLKHSVRAT